MHGFSLLAKLALLSFHLSQLPSSSFGKTITRHPSRTEGGIHLPVVRRETPSIHRRDGKTAASGLGDFVDVTYNVMITVGTTNTPLVLDTGSSDLWVLSDACAEDCITNLPLYPKATFQPVGLDAILLYGDSRTGTHAYGPIGRDGAGIAGLTVDSLYFAAINNTNTSVLATGSTGIFGLGFPVNSFIWYEVHRDSLKSRPLKRESTIPTHRFYPRSDYRRPSFPSVSSLYGSEDSSSHQHHARQSASGSSITDAILTSFVTTGPLLPRLVLSGELSSPMFSVTLQRDTMDIGGNMGLLSIGELPHGVNKDSLTWVNVRPYTVAQQGLPPPTQSPSEQYPMAWEVYIDDVYLDGEKLPRSSLVSSTIALSALVDTGNSLIRGPEDVVDSIHTRLGGTHFPCSTPHTLAFQIGGKMFPVDPRDFIRPAFKNSVETCAANLAATDTPVEGEGFLYSWSLGDPFFKSVLAAFHYGNITYPSRDPPRVGFLSTVPPDADQKLTEAVSAAVDNGAGFPSTIEQAPTGTFPLTATGTNGVPAAKPTKSSISTGNGQSNGARSFITVTPSSMLVFIMLTCLFSAQW